MVGARSWTEDEYARAKEMREKNISKAEIARALKRTPDAVDRLLRRRPVDRSRPIVYQVEKVSVPDFILADREKRANEPRTLTMMLCGDPPFSQSALARRFDPPRLGQPKAEKAYEAGPTYLDPAYAD